MRWSVGKVAAEAIAAVLASRFHALAIVFTVAGAMGVGFKIGHMVIPTEVFQHDVNASSFRYRIEDTGHGGTRFVSDLALARGLAGSVRSALADPMKLLGEEVFDVFGTAAAKVHTRLIVGGDRFIRTTTKSLALLNALPDALAVEMEGAALAQVCYELEIPFAAISTISDRADDTAHADLARFIKEEKSR